MAQNVSGPVKAHDDGDVDRASLAGRRRLPAGAQVLEDVLDGVDRCVLCGRTADAEQQHCCSEQEPVAAARHHLRYLMSEATCTFTILSGSVTVPLPEPGGAFFSLSTTSMPCTTSPTTVYWLSRLPPSANMMKNCELAVSTLSPRRAMPTMPRAK